MHGGRGRSSLMPILNFTFHGIGELPPSIDDAERDVWVSEAGFLSALDAIRGLNGAQVTFDDGNISDLTVALPALVERGMTGQFFIVAERIGKAGYLSAEDLRALHESGMEVGLHGMRHRPWRGLSEAELEVELVEARLRLESRLGRGVTTAACPFGSYDQRVLQRLQLAGFGTVFTSDGGAASPQSWLQPRNTLHRGATAADVDRIASRSGALRTAFGRAKTLIKRYR